MRSISKAFFNTRKQPKKAEGNFDEYECWNGGTFSKESLSFNDMAKKKE